MRAIWTGALSFGLVNIPVKLYSATAENQLDFDMLHKKDLSPVRFARVCKAEDIEIPFEEIVKGYQYEKGHYVVLTDDDFEKANIRLAKTISILDFVKQEEIDPIFFERPYYLEPDKGAQKPYALLLTALKNAGKVAVGRYVLRNREHLAIIKPAKKENIIILEQMRFSEELRSPQDLLQSEIAVDEQELKMALSLIDQLTHPFNPAEYKDMYIGELKRIISEKVEGKVPAAKGIAPTPTPVPDLMAILQKSLEEEKKKRERTAIR